MARAKLDTSRRYAQIFGIHEYGGVFEQDGKCFDAQGLEVGPGITVKPEEAPPPVAAAGPAPTPEPAPDLAEELAGLHPAQLAKLVTEAGETPHQGPGSKKKNIDLLLSLNG